MIKMEKIKDFREFIDICKTIRKEDYENESKENLVLNYESSLWSIIEFEKLLLLLESTEENRMKLHKANQELKKEMGMLLFVKEILETAEMYGYSDLSKVQQVVKHQEELRKMREGRKVTAKPSQ